MSYKGETALAGARRLSGIEVRRLPRRHRLQGSGDPRRDQGQRLGASGRRSATRTTPSTRTIRAAKARTSCASAIPAPPPWASSAPLCEAPPDQLARFNAIGNTNWLGLDNQGRDVRRARHLRLPHLGAVRLAAGHVLGRRRRRRPAPCRAISAAAPISSSSASWRSGRRCPRCSC